MKILLLALMMFAKANHSHDHVKHNMVLFGDTEFYASHIVYKVPHNFQVILRLSLVQDLKTEISREMVSYPKDQFIFLLDEMNISQIESKPTISGEVFRIAADGSKHVILEKLVVPAQAYSVIYFSDLPLSLERK